MQCETFSTGARVAVAVFIATLLVPGARVAAQEKVLHNFNLDGSGGASPLYGALITDEAGNLYGTTSEGGPPNRTGVRAAPTPCGQEELEGSGAVEL